MQYPTILRILGVLLMIFSLGMLPPVAIGYIYGDGAIISFLVAFALTLLVGLLLWLPFRKFRQDLKTRDGFLIVVLFWTVLCMFGALPLMLAAHPHLSFTNALFEATSGFTTTGTTVLTGIDYLPHAILYYRQQLQFLGGMGIIVLAVAILPMLGVGGMQLYRAETPGPVKDTKLTPRITQTAQTLWYIYVGLTVICAICYWFAGMDFFDAVCESFSTISTGGFSTHDSSFGFYHNAFINMIAIIFMLISATNFSLHFAALKRQSFIHYWEDAEFRAFIFIIVVVTVISTIMLLKSHTYTHTITALNQSLFNVVSLVTTTGLVSAPFDSWPTFVPFMIMIAALIGGCAASTSGGMKVIRVLLMYKQGKREVNRLIHPKAIVAIKLDGNPLSENIIQAIWGFLAIFILLFIVLLLMLQATGLDFTTAFGAIAACLSNAGAAIGNVSDTFAHISTSAKWILIFAMLAGRLEIFTLLILFTTTFWRG